MYNGTPATLERIADGHLSCQGDWTVAGIHIISAQIDQFLSLDQSDLQLDAAGILKFDTAGAMLLQQFVQQRQSHNLACQVTSLSAENQATFDLVATNAEHALTARPATPKHPNFFAIIGEQAIGKLLIGRDFMTFFGEIFLRTLANLRKPHCFQWRSLFVVLEGTGYRALPIIGLLSFLIGIVLTYEIGLQLKTYGANIFIVELIGIAILREFGPLITAIIIAGRTGSAFTAAIGTMKINEEVDALRTMGLSPIDRLVLPRIFGLIIAMPLLVVWADAFGVLGSIIMTHNMMGINATAFLQRFQEDVDLDNYIIGLSKAPIFAGIVAVVGCFQGLRVSGSADSVGRQTTISVVQAIFLIIIADAMFSILFSLYNI